MLEHEPDEMKVSDGMLGSALDFEEPFDSRRDDGRGLPSNGM